MYICINYVFMVYNMCRLKSTVKIGRSFGYNRTECGGTNLTAISLSRSLAMHMCKMYTRVCVCVCVSMCGGDSNLSSFLMGAARQLDLI